MFLQKIMCTLALSQSLTLILMSLCTHQLLVLAIPNEKQDTTNNKYSKEANYVPDKSANSLDEEINEIISKEDPDIDYSAEYKENMFRIQKVNLLWKKAKQNLSGEKLEQLYSDLKLHDKYEAMLKESQVDGTDKDGLIEERVLKNFKYIMEFYLPHYAPSDREESNEIPEGDHWDEYEKEVYFQDPKLQSMWNRAQQSGFSEQDLSMLKEEFEHQQMKIHEFHFVHNELYSHAGSVFGDNGKENSEEKPKLSPEEAGEKLELLKQHKMTAREGYMKLEHLVSNLANSQTPFADLKVKELWDMAKKTNWSSEELESFQEELRHFETKADKHSYYLNELKNSQDAFESEAGHEAKEKFDFLLDKATRMEKKMRQIHDDLQSKVEQALPHSEL